MSAPAASSVHGRFAVRALAGAIAAAAAGAAEPRWASAPAAQVVLGHTDNALISSVAPQASWFGETKLDSHWRRAADGRWEASGYLEGSWRHYFARTLDVRDQGGWYARGEVRWAPVPRFEVGSSVTGFGETSVVDFSETTDMRLIAVARLRGAAVAATTRFDPVPTLSLRATLREARVDYRTSSGDVSSREPAVRLEWRPLARVALTAAWRTSDRHYADRLRYTAGGRALAGTRLSLAQATAETGLQFALDSRGATSLGLRASRGVTRDGGSGYFDHRSSRGAVRFEHRRNSWRWAAELGRQEQVYRVQTGGTGIAPPLRAARRGLLELQLERRIGRRWTWQAVFSREAERGNLPEFDYAATTATSGLRFSL